MVRFMSEICKLHVQFRNCMAHFANCTDSIDKSCTTYTLGAHCKYKTSHHNREMGDRSSHAMLSRQIGRPRWHRFQTAVFCSVCHIHLQGCACCFFVLLCASFIVDNIIECNVWKYYLWLFPTRVIFSCCCCCGFLLVLVRTWLDVALNWTSPTKMEYVFTRLVLYLQRTLVLNGAGDPIKLY